MLSFDVPIHRERLDGDWAVITTPLDFDGLPDEAAFAADAITIPEAAHVQPVLYPDRPYWGDHLREVNEKAWYFRKTFAAPAAGFSHGRLRFEGVDYFADVWLNGQHLGAHEGAFAPFTLDGTTAIRPGEENTLIVRVTAPWDPPNPRGSYPISHVLRGLVKGLYEHGEGVIPPNVHPLGIWRPAWLLLDDGVRLDRVRIRTALDGTITLDFTATNTTNAAWEGTLALTAAADNHDGPGAEAAFPLTLAPGTHHVEQTLAIPEPRLWWPWDQGDPNLYALTARLLDPAGNEKSRLEETFGIRSVRLERHPDRFTFYINERPLFLRGSSYMPGVYLSQHDRESLARDVEFARGANLNLLRVHVHVSPPEVYDLCNRAGLMVWQDFELNWVHDNSPAFEARALPLQRDMIDMLGNHPAVIVWTSHNEPTMVMAHRENYEQHPDPALYEDARRYDPTRPVFICSGQMEDDWQRAGDIHTYYGALWSKRYTDVYPHHVRLNTEFGFEAPASLSTLQQYPDAWERLDHLEGKIETLWAYQAELTQYHVEHFRRTRATGTGGFVHFWLNDLVPQVGCGSLDSARIPKASYAALRRSSAPIQVALEHDGARVYALWVFNDLPDAYPGAVVAWEVRDKAGRVFATGEQVCNVKANTVQRVLVVDWACTPETCAEVTLVLRDADGVILAETGYSHPLEPTPRPKGYPWNFDPYLGFKVFDRPGAQSLADQSGNGLVKLVPLRVRENLAEWGMRQKLPLPVLSFIAKLTKPFVGG